MVRKFKIFCYLAGFAVKSDKIQVDAFDVSGISGLTTEFGSGENMKFTTNPKQYTWSDLLFSDFQHFLTSGRYKILSHFEIFSFTTVTCYALNIRMVKISYFGSPESYISS